MKFSIKKTRPAHIILAVSKQVLLFFLLLSFLNTIVFPSLFFTAKQLSNTGQLAAEPETCSSLAEYILQDCLDVYDVTPDAQENDINDIEELYDEVDLLNQTDANIHFWSDSHKIKIYKQDKYPLLLSCCFSPTPPPEYC